MNVTIKLVICILWAIMGCAADSHAGASNFSRAYYYRTLTTGVVLDIRRNTIVIDDDEYRMKKAYIYTGSLEDFHRGDRVKIFFNLPTGFVERIIKMSAPVDGSNGRNLGYLQK